MKKSICALLLSPLAVILAGCSGIGDKAADVSIIYLAAALLSLLLLVSYCILDRKRNVWFLLLFSSVLVVNTGYYLLSFATSLEWALWCNRISYLGSVFLPLSILMIILSVTRTRVSRWVPAALLALGAVIFFIAATPGYLPIYYREVKLLVIDGVTTLDKTYGPLHVTYLIYLLGYFAASTGAIVFAAVKKQLRSPAHAAVLLIALFVNLCVWLVEQLVMINFEFLSISYIISELFLLGLHMFLMENERLKASIQTPPEPPKSPAADISPAPEKNSDEQCELFLSGLLMLTQAERNVYDAYVSGKTTKQIMAELNIKENTLKFHNKNLYSKLGVSSRKQLLETYTRLKSTQDDST